MGERTSHPPGTLCWTDLGTSDLEAAKAFYGELFGWDLEDMPVEGDVVYAMARIGGKAVCGLYERPADHGPPAWTSYVTVASADETAARATELGATALQEPFDVGDSGRMAVLSDPTGAVFAIWEPRESIGAELVNDPGCLSLNQLNTDDPERAQSFYTELFGWRVDFTGTDEQDYWGLYLGDRINAGMMPLQQGTPAPPHWLSYFTTADLDATVAKIGELGGRVLVPQLAIDAGRISVAQDPQGAVFALFEGEVDP